jgi:transposase
VPLTLRVAAKYAGRVRAVVESMNGARFVHDTLEAQGWEVLVADAQRVMGLAPLACKVRHRSSLKNRVHSTLITFGKPCPVSDLFGVAGRKLLKRLELPEPWRENVEASVVLIDQIDRQVDAVASELKYVGADHPYVPLLMTAPGVGWLVGFSIACEIGDINRFSSPSKLCGYTGLCPRVIQSGETDRRGPISKHGPKYLRWALFEAALNACDHPLYKERYERTKKRLGRQRGPKVAQIELSRKLAEAIWHMLTRNQPFAPAGAPFRLAA